MDYLIYNQEGELLDVLNFETSKELDTYKAQNPLLIIEETDETEVGEDDLFIEDSFGDTPYL